MSNLNISLTITDTRKNADIKALENDLNGSATLVDFLLGFKEFHIAVANEVLKDEQGRGFDKKPRTKVDGRFDRKIETVKPLGSIEFYARMVVSESIVKIYEELFRRSPVDTGEYKAQHVVFFNKKLVASSVEGLKAFVKLQESTEGFKLKDTIRFLNVAPYARKLEYLGTRKGIAGKTKGVQKNYGHREVTSRKTGLKLKRPNGTYYLVYKLAKSKYSSIARFIKFSFLPNGADGISVQPRGGERTTFIKDGRPYLYPSIVIRLSDEGIKDTGVQYE